MNTDRSIFQKYSRALLAGERAGFISPVGFFAMHLFQGTAWILLILFALRKGAVGSPLFFAMIHAFGLGFLTLAALSVLVHVLPAAAGLRVGESLQDRGPIGGVLLGALFLWGDGSFPISGSPWPEGGSSFSREDIFCSGSSGKSWPDGGERDHEERGSTS